MANNTALTLMKTQQKQFQAKSYEHCRPTHGISPDIMKSNVLTHLKFPLGKETVHPSQRNSSHKERTHQTGKQTYFLQKTSSYKVWKKEFHIGDQPEAICGKGNSFIHIGDQFEAICEYMYTNIDIYSRN